MCGAKVGVCVVVVVGSRTNGVRVASSSVARFFIESVTLARGACVMAQNGVLQRLADSKIEHKGECDDATVGLCRADEFGGDGWCDAGAGGAAYALFC